MEGDWHMRNRTLSRIGVVVVMAGFWGCGSDGGSPATPDTSTGPENNAPVLAAQRDTAGVVGDTLRLTANATDPDGDEVSLLAQVEVTLQEIRTGYRADMDFDASTGAFWFVPGNRDVPERAFHFVAEDGRGGRDDKRFVVSVTGRSAK
jgi:hypothetical protein